MYPFHRPWIFPNEGVTVTNSRECGGERADWWFREVTWSSVHGYWCSPLLVEKTRKALDLNVGWRNSDVVLLCPLPWPTTRWIWHLLPVCLGWCICWFCSFPAILLICLLNDGPLTCCSAYLSAEWPSTYLPAEWRPARPPPSSV